VIPSAERERERGREEERGREGERGREREGGSLFIESENPNDKHPYNCTPRLAWHNHICIASGRPL